MYVVFKLKICVKIFFKFKLRLHVNVLVWQFELTYIQKSTTNYYVLFKRLTKNVFVTLPLLF